MMSSRLFRHIAITSTRNISRRAFSSSKKPISNVATKSRYPSLKFTAFLSFAIAGIVLTGNETYGSDVNKFNESASSIEDSVSLDKGIAPFQKYILEPLVGKNELIGYGVRTVTFLKMRVYGLGIYVNSEDIPRIEKILDSRFLSSFYDKDDQKGDKNLTHRQKILAALQDPSLSMILIENLINSQIRFTAKIVPLRNTDFNHLRDGLIKSIMACPKSKEILQQDNDQLPNGLDELRKLFGARKGSCPKGNSLYLEMQKDESIVVRYQEFNQKTGATKNHVLGEIKEPLVGKLLFMQYLSGPNPLSKETKEKCAETLATLC